MKELGPLTNEWHREVGDLASDVRLTGLITLGSLGHHIAEAARQRKVIDEVVEAADNEEAIRTLAEVLAPGDVVLVKGSRAMRMEDIVRQLLADPGSDGRRRGQ
jgi:UDP-N-acetylmuramoyl-tripeptide--D-alanyl-D-alanine ligase